MAEKLSSPDDIANAFISGASLVDIARAAWSNSNIAGALKAIENDPAFSATLKTIGSNSTLAEYAKTFGPNQTLAEYAKAIGPASGVAEAAKAFGSSNLFADYVTALEPFRSSAARWIAEFEAVQKSNLEKVLAPIREDHERHRSGYAALSVLHGALEAAMDDSKVTCYPPVLALIEALLSMIGDVHPTHADNLDVVFKPVIAASESAQQSKFARKSHSGRELQRRFVESAFLNHKSCWASQAAAVTEITPNLLDWVKAERAAGREIGRPLAPTNAANTVKGWISALLSREPNAELCLSESARNRRRKQKKS